MIKFTQSETYYAVLVSSCTSTYDFPAWISISPRGSSFEAPVVLQFVDTSPGGGGWNPRCTKQLSWKQIIVIWAASILDKDDNTTNVVQRNNQFKVAKIDLANLSYYCFGGLQFLRLRDAWSLLWHFHHWSGHQFMASTSATEWIPSISNLCKAMIVLTI